MSDSVRDPRASWLAWLRDDRRLAGEDEELSPSRQIFLLGGNPLPVRVSAAVLRPRHAVIVSTRDAASEIRDALRVQMIERCGVEHVDWVWLEAPHGRWQASAIRSAMQQAWGLLQAGPAGEGPVGLNYTGGTKPMVRHACAWMDEKSGERARHRCTYLDSRDGLVPDSQVDGWIPEGAEVPLRDVFAIHGLEVVRNPRTLDPDHAGLVQDISAATIDQDELGPYLETLPPLYPEKLTVPARLLRENLEEGEVRLRGQISATHATNFKKNRPFHDWDLSGFRDQIQCTRNPPPTLEELVPWEKSPEKRFQFLLTGWFEDWLADRLGKREDLQDVSVGIELQAPEGSFSTRPEKFEIDVVCMARTRPILFSCSLADGKTLAKHKAFESVFRASRFGGDLCRHVVATWIRDNTKLNELWLELTQHWEAPDRFRVLGFEHYQGKSAVTHVAPGSCGRETLDEMLDNWLKD